MWLQEQQSLGSQLLPAGEGCCVSRQSPAQPRDVQVCPVCRSFIPFPGGFRPLVSGWCADGLCQVKTFQIGEAGCFCLERVHIEFALRIMCDDGVLHAFFANEGGQGPGVYACQANNAACLEPSVEMVT